MSQRSEIQQIKDVTPSSVSLQFMSYNLYNASYKGVKY